MIDSAPEVMLIVDREGTILECNAAFSKRFERSREDLIGTCAYDLTPDAPERPAHMEAVFRDGEPKQFTEELPDRTIDTIIAPVLDSDGRIVACAIQGRDVTEKRRIAVERDKLLTLLSQTERLTHSGGWEYDISSRKVAWTDETFRIYAVDSTSYDPSDVDVDISFYADGSREEVAAAFERCVESGEPFDLEADFINGHGARRRVRAAGQAERRGGEIVRVFGNFADVTERYQASRELANAKALLDGILQSSADIIVARDLEGRVTFFNRAFEEVVERLFGRPARVGMRTMDLLPEVERRHWGNVLRRVHDGEAHHEAFDWEVDGEVRSYELSMVPIRDGDRIVGSAEFNRDVTETRRAALKALSAQKLESLGHLCAGVSHEYNNVLMGILGYAFHLEKRLRESEAERVLAERIKHLAERAAHISRQLLDFSRPPTEERVSVEVDKFVRQVITTLEHVIGEDIEVRIETDSGARVLGNPGQLQDVLVNLVLNARDAMPNGGTLRVGTSRAAPDPSLAGRLGVSDQRPYACLEVEDTGVGMDAATLDRAFEPFFTTKPPGSGTGLGLSAALGIVKGHDGAFEVTSRPGEGTRATVYLPCETY